MTHPTLVAYQVAKDKSVGHGDQCATGCFSRKMACVCLCEFLCNAYELASHFYGKHTNTM